MKGRMGRYWRMVGGPEGWVLEKGGGRRGVEIYKYILDRVKG